jgi:hypothetical protein
MTKHSTALISHASVDIVTSLIGIYGDKFGFSIGNSFGLFQDTVARPQKTAMLMTASH